MTIGVGRSHSPSRTCRSEWHTPDGQHPHADLAGTWLDRARARAIVDRSPDRPRARRRAERSSRLGRRGAARRAGPARTGRSRATTSRHRPPPPGRSTVPASRATAIAIAPRHLAQRGDRRVQRARGEPLVGDGMRPASRAASRNIAVGHGRRLGDDRPEPDAREHEHVVGLADLDPAPVEQLDRRRTASRSRRGRGRRSSARTSAGVASHDRGRVGERQHDRPLARPERVGHRAHARRDRTCRPPRSSRRGPSGGPAGSSRRGPASAPSTARAPASADFVRIEVRPTGVAQALRVDQRDRVSTPGQPQQPRDPDARRAGAGQHDPRRRRASRPVARSAARTPATTTAAVPWMSSLNDGTRPW